ncbi:MAG TPA: hypothetical protein VJU78_05275 [Chitinophagaceae bacterium]|nr:hypothetical protein [Chitinophagaceae bacterium]
MTVPDISIEQLRDLKIPQLMKMADNLLDDYIKFINQEVRSSEVTRCRELIITVHNIIDEKIDNGELGVD